MTPREPPPDAIVVLGCRVERSGALSPTLARRAAWGAVGYACGLGRHVVPCGGRRWGEHVEAERLQQELRAAGVPEEAIFPELLSLTTAENAIFASAVMRRIRARRALIVTCDWHMPRALASFRAVGVEALPLAVPPTPAPLLTRMYRAGHEVVSTRLDAWTLSRIARVRRKYGAHPFDEPAAERA